MNITESAVVKSDWSPADYADFPALPEGWRWQRGLNINGSPIIELRNKRWWGWKKVDYAFVSRTSPDEVSEAWHLLRDRGFMERWSEFLGPIGG